MFSVTSRHDWIHSTGTTFILLFDLGTGVTRGQKGNIMRATKDGGTMPVTPQDEAVAGAETDRVAGFAMTVKNDGLELLLGIRNEKQGSQNQQVAFKKLGLQHPCLCSFPTKMVLSMAQHKGTLIIETSCPYLLRATSKGLWNWSGLPGCRGKQCHTISCMLSIGVLHFFRAHLFQGMF